MQSIVLAVGDVNNSLPVDGDTVWNVELSRPIARLAPGEQQFPIGGELVNAGVAVSIRDVDVSRRRERHIGREIERFPGMSNRPVIDTGCPRVRWFPAGPQSE